MFSFQLTRSRNNLVISQSTGKPSADDNFLPEAPYDLQYHYLSVKDNPPISKDEFNRWYYACPEKCIWPAWAHCCDAPRSQWGPGSPKAKSKPSNESLQRIPKIRGKWEPCEDSRGKAYCITAFEVPYVCGLVVYMALSEIGGITFLILWLSKWNHQADLQNASVPFFTILMLWAALFTTGVFSS